MPASPPTGVLQRMQLALALASDAHLRQRYAGMSSGLGGTSIFGRQRTHLLNTGTVGVQVDRARRVRDGRERVLSSVNTHPVGIASGGEG